MLLLLFEIENETYGIDSRHVAELIPIVTHKPVMGTPKYMLGEINYKGENVLLVDLNQYFTGQAAEQFFSTRIAVVEVEKKKIGLLANSMIAVEHYKKEDIETSQNAIYGRKCFAGLLRTEQGRIQLIDIPILLDEITGKTND